MKRFVLTPRAKQDITDIWDYIADENIQAADGVLDALDTAILKLAKNPGIGHFREELADKRYRFFLVYSYLIVYRPKRSPFKSSAFSMRLAMCRAFLAWPRTSRA